MKQPIQQFARYVQHHTKRDASARSRIQDATSQYYTKLYGTTVIWAWQQSFTSLFQPPMNFAKIATYIVSALMASTSVYAWTAPESFARTNIKIQTAIQTNIDKIQAAVAWENNTSANINGNIRWDNKTEVSTNTDSNLWSRNDASLGTNVSTSNNTIKTNTSAIITTNELLNLDLMSGSENNNAISDLSVGTDASINNSIDTTINTDNKIDLDLQSEQSTILGL